MREERLAVLRIDDTVPVDIPREGARAFGDRGRVRGGLRDDRRRGLTPEESHRVGDVHHAVAIDIRVRGSGGTLPLEEMRQERAAVRRGHLAIAVDITDEPGGSRLRRSGGSGGSTLRLALRARPEELHRIGEVHGAIAVHVAVLEGDRGLSLEEVRE